MTEKRTVFLIVLAILFIAAFLRFHSFSSYPPGLYPDEAMNGSNALEALRGESGGFKAFYPENNGREGLFINIQALFLGFFLNFFAFPEPWMLRFPSALFGILTVLGVFFLGRELSRKSGGSEREAAAIGALSAFFIATSFWHINFSRIGFRAIMAPFFLAWGSYLLLRAEGALKKGAYAFPFLTAGAVYGLGMHSYIAYRATPLLMLLAFWWMVSKNGWKPTFKAFGFFLIGSIIVTLPLIMYFTAHPADFLGRTTQLSIFSSAEPFRDLSLNIAKTAQMFFFVGDGNARHNLPGAPQLFPLVALLFAVGIVTGLATMFSRKKVDFMFTFLFAWLVVASLPVIISNEGLPHALRAILMIPAAYILAGFGGWRVWTTLLRRTHPKIAYTFFPLLLLVVLFNAYYSYFVLWGENKETRGAFAAPYVEIANFMKALPRTIPKYVIVTAGGVDVRGLPVSAQTVMFLTDSFTREEQSRKNIRYVLPSEGVPIPDSAAIFILR